jgi:hypothetical protein
MGSLGFASGHRSGVVRRCALLLALLGLVALALTDGGASIQTGALMMAPVLAIAVVMLTRPYLGERILARLARQRPRHPVASLRLTTRWAGAGVARGGRLIAAALAGRAPPPALAGCR